MDFTGGAEIYDGLGEKLAGLDIGILGECLHVHVCQYNVEQGEMLWPDGWRVGSSSPGCPEYAAGIYCRW